MAVGAERFPGAMQTLALASAWGWAHTSVGTLAKLGFEHEL